MISNLRKMLARADATDVAEGKLAYFRYNEVMTGLANHYGHSVSKVTAAFCSLSPNSDYFGNLRSTASCLQGLNDGIPDHLIVVSTYNHCRDRALAYLRGQRSFIEDTKGPKIKNFYHNILDPHDTRWVTVDGHMVASWRGQNLTMKEALCTISEYREIKHAAQVLAFEYLLIPHQVQAIIWFARKRTLNIKYDGNLDFFKAQDDQWKTLHDPASIKPYPALSSEEYCKRTRPIQSIPHPMLFG